MAERTNGDAGAEIQVFLASLVPDATPLAARQRQRKAPVRGQDELREELLGGKRFGGGVGSHQAKWSTCRRNDDRANGGTALQATYLPPVTV